MQRSSGILLHPTALPGPYGIGSMGAEARDFADFLALSGQSLWQILPLGPTGVGNSPYNALSAFAGNPLLIDLDQLVSLGDLLPEELAAETFDNDSVNDRAIRFKWTALRKAGQRFFAQVDPERQAEYGTFCHSHSAWLDDYVLFMALRRHFKEKSWSDWPEPLRRRNAAALTEWKDRLAEEVALQSYQQFIFYEQWLALKAYVNRLGIRILGDIPIFVAYDSADVWAHQDLFRLDAAGQPIAVSGVPPDYFSVTGQLWGNPLYNWQQLESTGFSWWIERFRRDLLCADLVRIDHFRGFQACWAVPYGEKTAINGQWENVPGGRLFTRLQAEFQDLPVIAENLGYITPEVERLRHRFNFPGMKVLHFAFDSGPANPHLPANYEPDCVVYTGTHDNNTTLGWWRNLTSLQQRQVAAHLDKTAPDMPWDLIELAETSIARICILPCQDILVLGESARFNTPGKQWENWNWRMRRDQLTTTLAQQLYELCRLSDRIG